MRVAGFLPKSTDRLVPPNQSGLYSSKIIWVIWILAITISQVLKNAITIRLIGNLPLLFCFPLTLSLFYIWSVARPTCRCRISVCGHIAPVREDKAEQSAASAAARAAAWIPATLPPMPALCFIRPSPAWALPSPASSALFVAACSSLQLFTPHANEPTTRLLHRCSSGARRRHQRHG